MRVLVTAARAPAALELARSFALRGCTVFCADSFRFTVTGASRAVRQHVLWPGPRPDFGAFRAAVLGTLERLRIDLVVPTCEEVFYLAALGHPAVFCDSFERLRALHSKWHFLELAAGCGLPLPESRLAVTPRDLPADPRGFVCKREFTRFGSHTQLGRADCHPTAGERWVVQRRLRGQELSGYGVARQGRLTAWALYQPTFRIAGASSVYFRACQEPRAQAFAAALVARLGYTGQIAFDFMLCPDGLYPLECNPRATSGVHLLEETLAGAFLDQDWVGPHGQDRCLAAALPLAGRRPWPLPRGARDVLWRRDDWRPAWALLPHLLETVGRAVGRRQSLPAAATADLEWDGEPF